MTTNVGVITDQQTLDISSKTLEQCLKSTSQFSGTLYQNICDGTQYFVASGFWDYAGSLLILGIGVAVLAALVGMVFSMFFDSY